MGDLRHYDEINEVVKQIVSDILKVPKNLITERSALTDLTHIESIKLLRIAGKVERRFRIELDDEALFRDATIRDLVQQIITARERAA
jgi:acyl carrier protein